MSESCIALIILAVALVLYVTSIFPISVTTILAMLAMIFTGVLTPSEAFSGFSNTTTLTVAGMLVMGEAFAHTGLSRRMGTLLNHFSWLSEKWFNCILFVINALLSALFNSVVLMAIFMPVIDAIADNSNGKITRQGAYLPAAIGGVTGAMLSTIGATSGIHGFGLFETNPYVAAYGRTVSFFEPAILGIPAVLAGVIFYVTIGTKLQRKWFDFTEQRPAHMEQFSSEAPDLGKQRLTLAITGICAALWITGWLNIAAVSLAGACALMLTKCVDMKTVFSRLDWSTVIVVGGSVGFAAGIERSGAAELIAEFLLKSTGPISRFPLGACMILMITSTIISNFMSNTSAVTIMVPIAVIIAERFGGDPFPYALASITGGSLALSTPICTATITMTVGAGYRPKDFLRVGTAISLLAFILCGISLQLVYFS